MKSSIFFEFPDFGFGPASSVVSIMHSLKSFDKIGLLSIGSALDYVSQQFPQIEKFSVNTMEPNCYKEVMNKIPKGTRILSNTNPEFADWAINNGYKVVVWDILDWMWNDAVPVVEKSHAYITQYYYGPYRRSHIPENRVIVRPAFPKHVTQPIHTKVNDVLIGFGGMGNPYSRTLESSYVDIVLPALIESLKQCCDDFRVHVVGGLVNSKMPHDVELITHGPLPKDDYLHLLLTCRYKFLTPGVMSIYECIEYEQKPFFLPGSNVSQVLQATDLFNRTRYMHMWHWQDQEGLVKKLENLSEKDGIYYMEKEVIKGVGNKTIFENIFKTRVEQYITSSDSEVNQLKSIHDDWFQYPSSESIIRSLEFF